MPLKKNPPSRKVLERAQERWLATRRTVANIRAMSVAGTLTARNLVGLIDNLRGDRDFFDRVAAVPGIDVAAREHWGDPAHDILADLAALRTEITGTVDFLLAQTYRVDQVFTPQQTASLRTQLDALLTTIEA